LKLSRGKLASQVAHASLNAYKQASFIDKKFWELRGQKKVILKIGSERELLEIFNKARNKRLPCSLIRDAGKTEIEEGTITCVGIGPSKDSRIDEIVGHLKLY